MQQPHVTSTKNIMCCDRNIAGCILIQRTSKGFMEQLMRKFFEPYGFCIFLREGGVLIVMLPCWLVANYATLD